MNHDVLIHIGIYSNWMSKRNSLLPWGIHGESFISMGRGDEAMGNPMENGGFNGKISYRLGILTAISDRRICTTQTIHGAGTWLPTRLSRLEFSCGGALRR